MILNTKLQNILTGMNNPIKKVNAYNGWDPLKQIILGNVMSPSFFEDVRDTKLRHLLQKLLYETQEDLDNFQHELEKAGVDVIRIPENTMEDGSYYGSMNDAMSKDMSWTNGGMPRPFITPRDQFITIGNQLVYTHVNPGTTKVINELMEDNSYLNYDCMSKFDFERNMALGSNFINPRNVDKIKLGPFTWRDNDNPRSMANDIFHKCVSTFCWDAPFVTRVGDTLVVDSEDKINVAEWLLKKFPEYKQVNHAIGGHNDGTFCPLKPGHLITAAWHIDYSQTFPGWDVHVVHDDPNSKDKMYDRDIKQFQHLRNQKKRIDRTWWTPDAKNNEVFTKFVDEWLHQWTGWSIESIFEINSVVVNPELVFFSNYNKGVFDYCESIGITPHIVPFRHRHFWDGGLHCLTVDTVRESKMESYFDG
jgi:hypothetical protein